MNNSQCNAHVFEYSYCNKDSWFKSAGLCIGIYIFNQKGIKFNKHKSDESNVGTNAYAWNAVKYLASSVLVARRAFAVGFSDGTHKVGRSRWRQELPRGGKGRGEGQRERHEGQLFEIPGWSYICKIQKSFPPP